MTPLHHSSNDQGRQQAQDDVSPHPQAQQMRRSGRGLLEGGHVLWGVPDVAQDRHDPAGGGEEEAQQVEGMQHHGSLQPHLFEEDIEDGLVNIQYR